MPKARQVVDRWHLLQNAQQMAERWLTTIYARLRELPMPAQLAAPDRAATGRDRPFDRTRAESTTRTESRALRLAVFHEVRRRHAAGESLVGISRSLGLARAMVRKYAKASAFPERAARAPGTSRLDAFVPHLTARLREGCSNGLALWREIRVLGYPGTTGRCIAGCNNVASIPPPRPLTSGAAQVRCLVTFAPRRCHRREGSPGPACESPLAEVMWNSLPSGESRRTPRRSAASS